MWTAGGQLDHLTFAGMRKGSSGSNPYEPTTLTDPATGMTFTSTPFSISQGGQSAGDQMNAWRAEKAKNDAITQKQADDAKQQQAAAAESTFQTNKTNAYNEAMQDAIRTFQNQGLDPNAYMANYITPTLQRQLGSIQDLDPNPTAAFPTNLGQTIIDQATSDARGRALTGLNATFTPTYATNALPDSSLTPYVSQIVGEQFDPLGQQLINAEKRGTLTDQGYKAATDLLNQKRSAATSTVQSLGQNILAGDRSSLNDLISGARSDINNMSLGQNINPSDYFGQASSLTNTDLSGLGGALRNAVGNTQFTDITDLLNAGGAAQGSTNPTAANPNALPGGGTGIGVGPAPDQLLAAQKRGLGSTGAF
jgi:hypothetical protein